MNDPPSESAPSPPDELRGVAGVLRARPFHVQRLGHFGFLVDDTRVSLRFYEELLGLVRSDALDFARDLGVPPRDDRDSNGYFLRFAGDHHAFVLFPRWAFEAARIPKPPGSWSIAHAAWEVASLREVADGLAWAKAKGTRLTRPAGRDLPGGNWTFTMAGPDGVPHELYHGMDQIGWDGVSRPASMYADAERRLPDSDAIETESAAIAERIRNGVDLADGLQATIDRAPRFDVGGTRLARPFRIVGHGPLRLFAANLDDAIRYYTDVLGLTLTEEIAWRGHRAAFLRAGHEHHALALYDRSLRDTLGLRPESMCLSFGFRLGSYRQLRDAKQFLGACGVTFREIPRALTPGVEHATLAIDPDGNAIELYDRMDAVGWDGRPRPWHDEARAWPATRDDPQG